MLKDTINKYKNRIFRNFYKSGSKVHWSRRIDEYRVCDRGSDGSVRRVIIRILNRAFYRYDRTFHEGTLEKNIVFRGLVASVNPAIKEVHGLG